MADTCAHLKKVDSKQRQPVKPSGHGCKECLESGSEWMQLRLCMSCGHVGCCDSSPNKHATAHFHETKHPVIRGFEPGAAWAWCYLDEATAEAIPVLPGEVPSRHYSAP
ncbi:MAG TPA: UBP-type zinc finger domain-containing protein [Myxococcales bacterium]